MSLTRSLSGGQASMSLTRSLSGGQASMSLTRSHAGGQASMSLTRSLPGQAGTAFSAAHSLRREGRQLLRPYHRHSRESGT